MGPIDKFLNLDVKDLQKECQRDFANPHQKMTATDASRLKEDLQRPFSAHKRPIRHPDEDRTITKQRMGYFICFDLSDLDGDSLREAMKLYQMLIKALDKKTQIRGRPKIWLVGCKQDRSSDARALKMNKESAINFSNSYEIPFATTSARDHKGVHEAFADIIQAISSSEILWRMEAADDEDNQGGSDGGC